ncbi:hypothetical protein CY35_14G043800 [Sphagnum magellanicum]|nr:hypothetical protein CY35_14G043800 [Sphagnum magellanicum]
MAMATTSIASALSSPASIPKVTSRDDAPPAFSNSSSANCNCCALSRRRSEVAGRTGVRRRNAGDRRSLCIRAQSSGSPGDKESKQVLDAFFLGKAFAETVNERVGTVIGEILSDIGRRQAEQQKHIRDFQEEVQQRARSAAVKAARKALSVETSPEKPYQQSRTSTSFQNNGSASSSSEDTNGLPSLPYEDLPPLTTPPERPPSSDKGAPDL